MWSSSDIVCTLSVCIHPRGSLGSLISLVNTCALASWLVFHCKPAPLLENRLVWRQELILPSTFKCTGKYSEASPLGAAGFYMFCWPQCHELVLQWIQYLWRCEESSALWIWFAPQLKPKVDRGGWLVIRGGISRPNTAFVWQPPICDVTRSNTFRFAAHPGIGRHGITTL